MTVLLFLAVLFVLILVHEWGHFMVAKKNGIRVDEFGIGFPPKLFGIKKGETEYTFNLLPIGGFVRIFGENAEDAATDAAAGKDVSRSFVAKSKWVQAAVLVAGVAMNTLFAWFLFTIVFAVGVPTAVEEEQATDDAQLVISMVMEDTPAAEAGIPLGAVIEQVRSEGDTEEVLQPSTFSTFVAEHAGEPIEVSYYVGDGDTTTTTLTPEMGVLTEEPNRAAVGVALALVETVRSPIHIALWDGLLATLGGLRDVTIGLSTLLYDSVRGQADFSQVAGPVGIVGLVGDAAEFGWTSLLMFTAFISLNLAIINLLPFPALDGGRLLFVAIESVKGSAIHPAWVARLNFAGFALLILLMVVVTYNDVMRLL